MALYWIYEKKTGVNFCVRQTTNESYPVGEGGFDFDDLPLEITGPDPNAPDGTDMVPTKVFVSGTNTVQDATAGQQLAFLLFKAKAAKNRAVDRKTDLLFRLGFSHDGEVFPLAIDDSHNYLTWYSERNNSGIISYPKSIITRSRTLYSIQNANAMKDFGEAANARAVEIVDGARDLKAAIQAATSLAEIAAITDDRT